VEASRSPTVARTVSSRCGPRSHGLVWPASGDVDARPRSAGTGVKISSSSVEIAQSMLWLNLPSRYLRLPKVALVSGFARNRCIYEHSADAKRDDLGERTCGTPEPRHDTVPTVTR